MEWKRKQINTLSTFYLIAKNIKSRREHTFTSISNKWLIMAESRINFTLLSHKMLLLLVTKNTYNPMTEEFVRVLRIIHLPVVCRRADAHLFIEKKNMTFQLVGSTSQ